MSHCKRWVVVHVWLCQSRLFRKPGSETEPLASFAPLPSNSTEFTVPTAKSTYLPQESIGIQATTKV
jgi:hypothetical protein